MRQTSQSVDQAAAGWAARLDRAPLSAREEDELDIWLQADIRHQGALLRAQALLVQPCLPKQETRRPPTSLRALPTPVRSPKPARKGWLRLGTSLAASLLLGIFMLSLADVPKAYATVKGEIRTLPLADGSSITLNTETRIKVHDDAGQLRIQVLRGEVFVQSMADSTHPLIVEVSGRKLQATHASFNVSKLDGAPEQVTVHNGNVELKGRAGAIETMIASRQRVSIPESAQQPLRPTPLSPDEIERQLAWREGKLAFHGETLADAAKAFSRYSHIQLVIADETLANRQVIGLYAANNPVGFARATAKLLDARVEQSNERVAIRSKD